MIRDEYPEAREKLLEEAKGKAGEDLINSEMWQAFIDVKEDPTMGAIPIQTVVAKHPDSSSTYCLAARMLSWEGFEKQSRELVDQAYEKFPGAENVLIAKASRLKSSGDSGGAISVLLSGDKIPKPTLALNLADTYEEMGEQDAALETLRTSYLHFPKDNELKFRLAKTYIEAKQPKQALALLRGLTLEFSESSDYWGYFGNAALLMGLSNTTMVAYRKASELNQGQASWVLGNIGNLLNNCGFFDDAIEYFHKSLEIEPDSQYSHERLASTLGNMKNEEQKNEVLCAAGWRLISEPSAET